MQCTNDYKQTDRPSKYSLHLSISNFATSIDFDGRPYNTLTLPCERVIMIDNNEKLPNQHKLVLRAYCWARKLVFLNS